MHKLEAYQIKDGLLSKRDTKVCRKILDVYVNENNNKDIPVMDPNSDSSTDYDESEDNLSLSNHQEGDIAPNALPNSVNDSAHSQPSTRNPRDSLLPEDMSSNEDIEPRHLPEPVGSFEESQPSTPNVQDSLKPEDMSSNEDTERKPLPDSVNSSTKSQPSTPNPQNSLKPEDMSSNEDTERNPLPDSVNSSTKSQPSAINAQDSLRPEDKQLDDDIDINKIPDSVNSSTKSHSSTTNPQNSLKLNDMRLKPSTERVEPIIPPSSPVPKFDPIPPEDVFSDLRIPWDPNNNWEPLDIEDEEFETDKNCEFPFQWNDPSSLTLDERIKKMVEVLNPKSQDEMPLPSIPTEVPSKEEGKNIRPRPIFVDTFSMPKVEPIKPNPFIIAVFVVLMLCCVAGFITCGVLLAKIN